MYSSSLLAIARAAKLHPQRTLLRQCGPLRMSSRRRANKKAPAPPLQSVEKKGSGIAGKFGDSEWRSSKKRLWNKRWLRMGLRGFRVVALCGGIYAAGYSYGQLEIVDDPDEYDRKVMLATLNHCQAQKVLVLPDHEPGKGEKATFMGMDLKDHKPHVTDITNLYTNTSETPAESRRISVSKDDPMWILGCASRNIFARVKLAALHVVQAKINKLREQVRDAGTATSDDLEEFEKWRRARRMLRKDWQIICTDNGQPNAFVSGLLPRRIFVFVGLLQITKDPDQLAMVMAHELSHALLNHSKEQASEDLILRGASLMLVSLIDPVGIFSAAVEILGWGSQVLLSRGFSREHEDQADTLGAEIAAMGCFDPGKFGKPFHTLAQMEKDSGVSAPSDWLRTHPHPEERSMKLANNAAALAKKYEVTGSRCYEYRKATMCGIGVLAWVEGGMVRKGNMEVECEAMRRTLARRGPDACETVMVTEGGKARGPPLRLCFIGAVLHMRGSSVTEQPVVAANGNVTLWNGEAWGGISLDGCHGSDTRAVASLLCSSSSSSSSSSSAGGFPRQALESIVGPWALLFWDKDASLLWFGRDPMGRKSLQYHVPSRDAPFFAVCSAGAKSGSGHWVDVQPGGLYSADFSSKASTAASAPPAISFHPWTSSSISPAVVRQWLGPSGAFRTGKESLPPDSAERLVEGALSNAVRRRVQPVDGPIDTNAARDIAVLFSGGLDCTLVSAMAHRHAPAEGSIDLLSVCFSATHNSPDRRTALQSFCELCEWAPQRRWRLFLIDVAIDDVHEHCEHIRKLVWPGSSLMDFNIGAALWFAARGHGKVLERPAIARAMLSAFEGNNNNNNAAFNPAYGDLPQETSAGRVVFSGIGADELFAGYI
eukprot:g4957.t1